MKYSLNDIPHTLQKDSLALVFDFDGTIHKKHHRGTQVPSVISILRSEHILHEGYSQKAYAFKEIYHKIEQDPHVPFEAKSEKMHEWWEKHIELLIENKLTRAHIRQASYHENLIIREGVVQLFNFAKKEDIPIIIFSASGTGIDSIYFFLERHNIAHSNVHIVSNRLEYKDGVMTKVLPPIIHALNKNEAVLAHFPEVQAMLLKKKTVLLVGDSINDHDMVSHKNHMRVIRVGLLNEIEDNKKTELMTHFQGAFDIVIESDGSLEPVYEQIVLLK